METERLADAAIVDWLLEGDPAIRWQTMRDLLDAPAADVDAERARVTAEGWGAGFLGLQDAAGAWGPHVYGKWTGTFYTMLVLHALGVPAGSAAMRRGARVVLDAGYRADGGLSFGADTRGISETCCSGMGMTLLARYGGEDERIDALFEHLLREQMPDGGWNCRRPRGATHSSFHTTISVLDGLLEWTLRTHDPRAEAAAEKGRDFLYAHRLFRSHRTGAVVKNEFTHFHFPPRWHYDVLRGLDYLRAAGAAPDDRAADAIALVESRRRADGRWQLARAFSGPTSLVMEGGTQPSRWNTLRCLRVLRWWASKDAVPA